MVVAYEILPLAMHGCSSVFVDQSGHSVGTVFFHNFGKRTEEKSCFRCCLAHSCRLKAPDGLSNCLQKMMNSSSG